MELEKIAELVNGKAALYDDLDLAFAAQQLELHTQMVELPPKVRRGVSDGLVSVSGAADYLSLSVDYVWKLIYMGEIKSLKIGKRRLIKRAELDNFVRRHTQASDGEPEE